MKTKIVFATATALGLLMATGAYAAGSNDTSINVHGADNNATVDQSGGNGNKAGTVTYSTGPDFQLWQAGSNNTLLVTQTGQSNTLAWNSNGRYSAENYIDSNHVHHTGLNGIQDGDNNKATIFQQGGTSAGNDIGSYYQLGNSNTLQITEQTDVVGYGVENAVGEAYQNNTGGTGNTLTITQTSLDGFVAGQYEHNGHMTGNTVAKAWQKGAGGTATVTQTGNRNFVGTLTQSGSTDAAVDTAIVIQNGVGNRVNTFSQTGGSGNTAKLDLEGDYNGSDRTTTENGLGSIYLSRGWTYATASFSPAAGFAGATQGTVTQLGSGNTLSSTGGGSFLVHGSDNAFGFYQDSNGSANGNVIDGTGINGNGNQIAVSQSGSAKNSATLNITGGYNELGVKQIDGGTLVANINGDNNNASGHSFTEDALGAAGSLIPGQIYQSGLGNSITLNVGDSLTSSSNLFAFSQTNGDNKITTTITGGSSGNQVAITQSGGANKAVTLQNGSNNNIGVLQ